MAYSRFHPGKYSLWMDWETSGADFGTPYEEQAKRFQGISVGLVIADNETFEEVDAIKIDIIFDENTYEWQDKAQSIHGLTREFLRENGVSQEDAAVAVIEFVTKYFGQDVIYLLEMGEPHMKAKVALGGHNLEFDVAHLKHLLEQAGFGIADHHVRLNTATIGFVATGLYKSDDLFQFFGADAREDHDSLEDTRQALAVARGVKALIVAGLSS